MAAFFVELLFRLVLEDESHFHCDTPLGDTAVLDDNLLALDPCAGDVVQRLGGARNTGFDSIVEALCG